MSWKEISVDNERVRFIEDWLKGEWSVVGLARAYGISRKTAYKWIGRFKSGGFDGLADRSRAPDNNPNAVPDEMVDAIVAMKLKHQHFGPRKVLALLERADPEPCWPSSSTVGAILGRHGLVSPRTAKRKSTPSPLPFVRGGAPNEVWCADFKGWFMTGDGARCMPLTITDHYSRYLLCCRGLGGRSGFEEVRPDFELAFRTYGLPDVLHTDNGPPFASTGLAGLSRLAVWLLKLGILPQRSRAGHPQDNGRHERMHRTLREYTADPPAGTLLRQQERFVAFVREYNDERPHEALGQTAPAQHYRPSPRSYPERLVVDHAYPDDWTVRKIKNGGRMKWRSNTVSVSISLTGEHVGLKPVDDGVWEMHFLNHPVGIFDERKLRMLPLKKKRPEAEADEPREQCGTPHGPREDKEKEAFE